MFETQEFDPFDFNRLYGNEKYNLQNMELKSVNVPKMAEEAHRIYDDRTYTEWRKAGEDITSTMNGDAFWAGVSDADLLLFAQRMADTLSFKHKVTGARITRHTKSSGYPCLLLEMYSGGKGVRRPKKRSRSYGRYGDGPMGVFEDFGPDDEDCRGI